MFDESRSSIGNASLLLESMKLSSVVYNIESTEDSQYFNLGKSWYYYVLRLKLYSNNIFNKD